MKPIIFTLFSAALLLLTACNPNRIFNVNNSDFPNHRWMQNAPILFSVPIEDTISEHKVYLALRHVYGFQFDAMNIRLKITDPSGKSATKDYQLQIKDGEDAYLSDCSGDICDLEVMIEDHVKFTIAGDWSFEVANNMDITYVPNVMELGLIIDKYPELNE